RGRVSDDALDGGNGVVFQKEEMVLSPNHWIHQGYAAAGRLGRIRNLSSESEEFGQENAANQANLWPQTAYCSRLPTRRC
ncbi:MAG TPA: hypothetical protein VL793_06550, partial [Patescibacteria group bacterium]|nr:hypothetical protein [Patescibacteria group bacterium]